MKRPGKRKRRRNHAAIPTQKCSAAAAAAASQPTCSLQFALHRLRKCTVLSQKEFSRQLSSFHAWWLLSVPQCRSEGGRCSSFCRSPLSRRSWLIRSPDLALRPRTLLTAALLLPLPLSGCRGLGLARMRGGLMLRSRSGTASSSSEAAAAGRSKPAAGGWCLRSAAAMEYSAVDRRGH